MLDRPAVIWRRRGPAQKLPKTPNRGLSFLLRFEGGTGPPPRAFCCRRNHNCIAGPLIACALALANAPANAQAGATPPTDPSTASDLHGPSAHPPAVDDICHALEQSAAENAPGRAAPCGTPFAPSGLLARTAINVTFCSRCTSMRARGVTSFNRSLIARPGFS